MNPALLLQTPVAFQSRAHPKAFLPRPSNSRYPASLKPGGVMSRETVTRASAASHAPLHDFCMGIPFGGLMTVAGAAVKLFGKASSGLPIMAMGAAIVVSSFLSLKTWKKGKSSAPFTILSTGFTVGIMTVVWKAFNSGPSKLVPGGALAVSGAMALFLLYNLLAGGNPPPKNS